MKGTAIQQPFLSNGAANNHISTATIAQQKWNCETVTVAERFKACIIEVWLLLIGLIFITWQALLPHRWQLPSVTFGSRNSYKKKWNRRPLFEADIVWTGSFLFPAFTYSRECSFWQRNNILSRVFTPSPLAAADGCGQKTAQKNLQMIGSTQPVLPTVKNRSSKCRR